ncbi:DUF4395 domain-containing protein [Sulfurimonas sp. MAG313]|nr:DUF4395 domain-containing protein [Sulfurimonas sp. MAG313]MDF1880071.1 DUF4395 domain-containing protein [Sulfurimonas sp. MAG313]
MDIKEFFAYGEKVEGYSVRVLNEREARAAAGLLFAFGLLALMNSVALGHVIFTKFYIAFFMFDFTIRVIQPRYSPSLLLGRFFVQNQKPEYVGAIQKRFAWGIGFLLVIPMFYTLVIHFTPTPIKVLICVLCLFLLLFESAFSICLGCKIYGFISKQPLQHCPGEVCEMNFKEPIQGFNTVQKIIVVLMMIGLSYGMYSFMFKLENKTFLGDKMTTMMMSQQAIDKQDYQKELDEFNDDSF